MKYVSPSVKETAFNCPHCGALATQFWGAVFISRHDAQQLLPTILGQEEFEKLDLAESDQSDERKRFEAWFMRMISGVPFIEKRDKTFYLDEQLRNCTISQCFNCNRASVWIHSKLVYPVVGNVLPANSDMSDDVRRDYEEASSILNQSPRGAAALLRLAIQKLCKELGQPGKNINDDIKALVESGLDKRVQQALDAVRVIGNFAVHPGLIDIKDDRASAEALFKLLNLIVDKTISEPKHVQEIYDSLPGSLLAAIEKRDAPKNQ